MAHIDYICLAIKRYTYAYKKTIIDCRIGYYAVADYTEGSCMDKLLINILDKTAENRTDG